MADGVKKPMYEKCMLCPNACGVDRRVERGVCGEKDEVRIAWSGLHRGEEPPLSGDKGSGMIFFTGCPLHCRYCQNIQISSRAGKDVGVTVSDEELKHIMLSLEEMGAKSLNLVTGTHFIPSIANALKLAKAEGFSLPVVWNSSGYESPEALGLIDPYIDIYLVDMKSLSPAVCSVFCGRRDYADHIIPVMDYIISHHPTTDMGKMKGTIVRHLVFPDAIKATLETMEYFAKHYKESCYFSLMVQFVPPKGDVFFPPLSDDEYDCLLDALDFFEIDNGFIQEKSDDDILWIPDFRKDVPFPESFCDPLPYFLELKHKQIGISKES